MALTHLSCYHNILLEGTLSQPDRDVVNYFAPKLIFLTLGPHTTSLAFPPTFQLLFVFITQALARGELALSVCLCAA